MTTITCTVPCQKDVATQGCTAVFSSSGILLVINGWPLGQAYPDDFSVDFEDSLFQVVREGNEHVIDKQDIDVFTAMVFG